MNLCAKLIYANWLLSLVLLLFTECIQSKLASQEQLHLKPQTVDFIPFLLLYRFFKMRYMTFREAREHVFLKFGESQVSCFPIAYSIYSILGHHHPQASALVNAQTCTKLILFSERKQISLFYKMLNHSCKTYFLSHRKPLCIYMEN